MSESMTNGNGRLRRPVYDHRISLGNIVSLAVVLGAVIAAFYETRGDIRANAKDIINLDRRVIKVENRTGLGERPAFERPR